MDYVKLLTIFVEYVRNSGTHIKIRRLVPRRIIKTNFAFAERLQHLSAFRDCRPVESDFEHTLLRSAPLPDARPPEPIHPFHGHPG